MAATFQDNMVQLELIADGECYCEEGAIERCKTCCAAGTLNTLAEIAHHDLKELQGDR